MSADARTLDFRALLRALAHRCGLDPDALHVKEAAALAEHLTLGAREVWRSYQWPDTIRMESRPIRAVWATGLDFDEGTVVYVAATSRYWTRQAVWLDFDATTAYAAGDHVVYNGHSWLAVAPTRGVASVTIDNPGSGIVSMDISFSGGGGSGAAATNTISGGEIVDITVTNSGSGYTSAPTVVFTPNTTGAAGTAVMATAAPGVNEGEWTDLGAVHQTPGTVSGEWVEIEVKDNPHIMGFAALDQYGNVDPTQFPMTELLDAWDRDPRKDHKARRVGFSLTDTGIYFEPGCWTPCVPTTSGTPSPVNANTVWCRFRIPPPKFTTTAWDTGTNYVAGDVVYVAPDCYLALSANAATAPASNPTEWRAQRVPEVLREPILTRAKAEWLSGEGEDERAVVLQSMAQESAETQSEIVAKDQKQGQRYRVVMGRGYSPRRR